MEITAVQTLNVAQAAPATQKPAAAEVQSAPSGPARDDTMAAPVAEAAQSGQQEESQSQERGSSMEEQAIRAAFLAQLSSTELLSVVRDPADLVLPDTPDAVV